MAASDEPVLRLSDVEVHFEKRPGLLGLGLGGESEVVRAVDGVSIEVAERDVVSLVGESGCGKTTLGKAAIGLQRPTGGAVEYRGHDVWAVRDGTAGADADVGWKDVRSALQIIHQDPGASLNPNRRIRSILSVPIRLTHPGLGREERLERIYAILERVGMTPATDFAERYPHQLSGGEKQRVALSRALLMNPDVILADEAISALDVSLRVEMMDLMLDLREEFDTSYVFVSHDLSNARYFTAHGDGRIGVMYLGELVEIGPAEAVIENPRHPYTEVLRWATPDLSNREAGDPPVRRIDVPDPIDPPSGCRFHTRCPEARDVCRREAPPVYRHGDGDGGGDDDGDRDHRVACFREDEAHAYWDSRELASIEAGAGGAGEGEGGNAGTD